MPGGDEARTLLPLSSGGQLLGSLTCAMAGTERRIAAADLPLVRELARQLALRLEQLRAVQGASRG